jgi:hypothetical protein
MQFPRRVGRPHTEPKRERGRARSASVSVMQPSLALFEVALFFIIAFRSAKGQLAL